ncbi:MAG: phosphatase PAP2 family protein [Chloroflexota bacterium]
MKGGSLTDATADLKRRVAATSAPKPPHKFLTACLYAYLLLAAVAFVVLAFFAHGAPYFPIDLTLTRDLQSFNPPWFDLVMRSVNWMGFGLQSIAIISVTVIVTFLLGWRWEAVVGALDAAGIWAFNIVVGVIVARPYVQTSPAFDGMLVDLTKPSFPSGHATSYIAFYGFMCYLVYTRVTQAWLRLPLVILFGALVVLVGPSRVYMGRHWPSDTLASILLGSMWLVLTIYSYQWGKQSRFVRKHFTGEPSMGAAMKSNLGVK